MDQVLAITGIGLASAAGRGVPALVEALAEQQVYVGPLPEDIGAALPMADGALLHQDVVHPGERVHRAFWGADQALAEALARAQLPPDPASAGRRRLSLGTALAGIEWFEGRARDAVGRPFDRRLLPEDLAAPAAANPDDLTRALAERYGLGGPVATFSATCASALYAIEQGCADLHLDRADVVVCGGYDTLSRFMQAGFCALGALGDASGEPPSSTSATNPDGGLILGEAACFVVLERLADAQARGARIMATLAGRGICADASHLTAPDPEGKGMIRAVEACLDEAGRLPEDIAQVSITAGASVKYAEMYEAVLASEFRGSRLGEQVQVLNWEGSIGHVLAASGAVGIAHAALRLDPLATGGTALAPTERGGDVLALTVGFGGQNGAHLLRSSSPAGQRGLR